jgi:hypothetical protein
LLGAYRLNIGWWDIAELEASLYNAFIAGMRRGVDLARKRLVGKLQAVQTSITRMGRTKGTMVILMPSFRLFPFTFFVNARIHGVFNLFMDTLKHRISLRLRTSCHPICMAHGTIIATSMILCQNLQQLEEHAGILFTFSLTHQPNSVLPGSPGSASQHHHRHSSALQDPQVSCQPK